MENSIQLPSDNWTPRSYQLSAWKYLERGGKRAVLVWPRRHGKDYLAINWTAVASQMRVGLYWLVYPYLNQGRRIAWSGMSKEGRKFIDSFPPEIVASKKNTEMTLELKNGSIIQIMGADHPDRFVGSNPVGIVFSEWPLMNPMVWKLCSPILRENDGWAIWAYTPRGENHGLETLNYARKHPDWFSSKLTCADTKILSAKELEEAREELNDDALFRQEFFTSFSAPLQGAYYYKQFKQISKEKRVCSVPVDPALPVTTAWDLGVNDSTCIWFVQVSPGREVRIVHYYENQGEALSHYIQVVKQFGDAKGVMFDKHLAPHDIKVRELGTGKSRLETARELGFRFTPVAKLPVEDGINAVRNLLSRCYFDRNPEVRQGVNALKSYRREYDDSRQSFKNTPLHDWASHPADAFRTLAVGMREKSTKNEDRPRQAQTEYSIFGA